MFISSALNRGAAILCNNNISKKHNAVTTTKISVKSCFVSYYFEVNFKHANPLNQQRRTGVSHTPTQSTRAMDRTEHFKESVRQRRQTDNTLPAPDKSRILKLKERDEFTIKAKDIRHQLTQLRDLLVENRVAYMRLGCHLKATAQMSDEERDIIDEESEKILTICNQYIKDLKVQSTKKQDKQLSQHSQGVLDILTVYLQSVFKIHNEQRTCRVQHELDTYKLMKLESNKKLIPVMAPRDRAAQPAELNDREPLLDSRGNSDHSDYGEGDDDDDDEYDNNNDDDDKSDYRDDDKYDDVTDQKKKHSKSLLEVAMDEDNANASKFALEEEMFSAEDIQMFESENSQLYNELKGLSEEVEQIEKSVFGIAKLQEIFTEKVKNRNHFFLHSTDVDIGIFCFVWQVTTQKHDIDRIVTTVVGATENIKDANEQIKQAMQRNAGLRVWVLFFLIVMSFTLLFLDWYND